MEPGAVQNATGQAQVASCEGLVLNGKNQLGQYGPAVIVAVAAGATAEEFSEVTTLAGSGSGDTAQIVCEKSLMPSAG